MSRSLQVSVVVRLLTRQLRKSHAIFTFIMSQEAVRTLRTLLRAVNNNVRPTSYHGFLLTLVFLAL